MSVARQHIAALDADSLHAIEQGALCAPFSILGVQRAAGGRLLRVNAPGAWRVEARSRRDHSMITVLDQSQTPGLFSAPYDSDAPYLLRVYWPGRVDEYEDPYSFPNNNHTADLRLMRMSRARGAGDILGAHLAQVEGVPGVRFAFWAPTAASVAITGDFNDWSDRRHPMERNDDSGVWELFIPRVNAGARYVFAVRWEHSHDCGLVVDPCARERETAPRSAGIVCGARQRSWRDERFLAIRRARRDCAPPSSIYRIEPDAWIARDGRVADWVMLGERLPPFACALGFTHIQIGCAIPDDLGWTFAPPPQFGTAPDFEAFVDNCHEAGLGVIIEWDAADVFTTDEAASGVFVENILADSAMRWLEAYHVDGLSMRASSDRSQLLERLREDIETNAPGALLIVEEPFDDASHAARQWRADWLVDLLSGKIEALRDVAASCLESVVLPVTPQTLAQFTPAENAADQLALLRAVYAFAWLTPGMKLMHMGAELGQHKWPDGAVAWEKLDAPETLGFLKFVRDLNNTLRNEAPIRLSTRVTQMMTWIDAPTPVIAYVRSGEAAAPLLVATNTGGEARRVRVQVPGGGRWIELLNTDSHHYGGADVGNFGGALAETAPDPPGAFNLDVTLPPRGTIIFRNHA